MRKIIGLIIMLITSNINAKLEINSPDFKNGDFLKDKFTCTGNNEVPILTISNVSSETKSFVLIVDDPDAPQNEPFVHWVLYNIPSNIHEINSNLGNKITQGVNSFGKIGFGGPCPPKGNPPHRYFYKLYALDKQLNLKPGIDKEAILNSINGHVLETAEIIGLYQIK